MIELKEKYQEFLELAFPERLGGQEIDGVDLVLLDTSAAELLEKYILSKGKLTSSDWKLLQQLNSQLKVVKSQLESSASIYFERLSCLTNLALTFKEADKD